MYIKYGKRCFDLVLLALGAIFLVPILCVIAATVYFMLGSPVLFRQKRPGLKGRIFTMQKFRSMLNARDSSGNPLPDSARLTRFGKILRSTSLDELPELWSVFKGDMSIVGPRPLLEQYLERYSVEQMRRHDVLPGITGWAQVNGRNAISWEEKFKLDVWYVDNCSFLLDVKILWMTIAKVLKRQDINQQGHVTQTEFLGTTSGVENGS